MFAEVRHADAGDIDIGHRGVLVVADLVCGAGAGILT